MTTEPTLFEEAYAALVALRENLPQGRTCPTSTGLAILPPVWVEEFEHILTKLEEASGYNLRRFSVGSVPPEVWYDRDILKTKIDSVLNLFELHPPKIGRPIGFLPPS